MDSRPISVVIAGVGGQGVLLLARLLGEVALRSGLEVKSSEVHGMAQRGGAVLSQVRFGPRVASPLTPRGEADYLIALEELEALRVLGMLRPQAQIFLQRARIDPGPTRMGIAPYPTGIEESLRARGWPVSALDPQRVWTELGSDRPANIWLLGVLAAQLEFPASLWLRVLDRAIKPAYRQLNRRAFRLGWKEHLETDR